MTLKKRKKKRKKSKTKLLSGGDFDICEQEKYKTRVYNEKENLVIIKVVCYRLVVLKRLCKI